MTEQTDAAELAEIIAAAWERGDSDIAAILASDWLAAREAAAEARGAERALRVVRLVEADMAEVALKAWRSADARRGLSDHDELLIFADAMTRWSERFRMAFDGEDYRTDRAAAARGGA